MAESLGAWICADLVVGFREGVVGGGMRKGEGEGGGGGFEVRSEE